MRLDVGNLEMAEECDRAAVGVRGVLKHAGRIGGVELAHFDPALRREHVLLEPMCRKLVEIALGILHREREEPDVVMRNEIQVGRQQHALTHRPVTSAAPEDHQDKEEANGDTRDAHRHLGLGRLGGPT